MEAYVLGLDGGGTKTLAQAMDAQGAPLFCVRGGALNANSEAYRRVRDTVQDRTGIWRRCALRRQGQATPMPAGCCAAPWPTPVSAALPGWSAIIWLR